MFLSTAYADGISSILKNDASLSDYFTSQFQNLTPLKILIGLGVGCLVGLLIAFVYKRCYRGVLYSPSFAMTLMMLTLITTPVVMCIKSDIAPSMGMVGALSIVRFRTAVKDPMDTVFMFWSLAAGVITGAQLYTVAIIASVVLGILMLVISLFKFKKSMPYILVLRFEDRAKAEVQALLRRFPQGRLKNKTVSRGLIELTIEMNVNDSEIALMDRFADISGVHDASLISYTGDIVA